MGKLFSDLAENQLLSCWADTLDWLLNDNRFSVDKGWNKNLVSKYTKTLKRQLGFSQDSFTCKKSSELDFPGPSDSRCPFVMMQKDESCGKDLIRHIRNGIAHGQTTITNKKGELFIKINDYNRKGQKQTAYIHVPLSSIPEMASIYHEIEKAIRNDRSGLGIKDKSNDRKKVEVKCHG